MIRFLVVGLVVAAIVVSFSAPTTTAASTFVVNSPGDPGNGACDVAECTMREAIDAANASPGLDSIHFNIPGSDPAVTPLSELPPLNDPVTIDATTQPGFVGTPIVSLIGDALATGNGLTVSTADSTITGLSIIGFPFGGIRLVGTDSTDNRIIGNFIGTRPDGVTAHGNDPGVFIADAGRNWIGGSSPGDGNLISGNIGYAIGVDFLHSPTRSVYIKGNRIGVSVSGAPLPNDGGIALQNAANSEIGGSSPGEGNVIANNAEWGILGGLDSSLIQGNEIVSNGREGIRAGGSNQIGGASPASRNVISGNGESGIYLDGEFNTIYGNLIGTDATGATAMPNGLDGIQIIFSGGNVIGRDEPGYGNVISGNLRDGIRVANQIGATSVEGNLIGVSSALAPLPNGRNGILLAIGSDNSVSHNEIAFNGGRGVLVTSSTGPNSALGNTVRQNSIHDNGDLGIDLSNLGNSAGDGPTPNDALDSDVGPNGVQNYPVVDSISDAPAGVHVAGTMSGMPNSSYLVDLYASKICDPSGFGEGAEWLAAISVTTNATGLASFAWDGSLHFGRFVTLTATDSIGSTSEFSDCAFSRSVGGSVELAVAPAKRSASRMPRLASVLVAVGAVVASTLVVSRLTLRRRS